MATPKRPRTNTNGDSVNETDENNDLKKWMSVQFNDVHKRLDNFEAICKRVENMEKQLVKYGEVVTKIVSIEKRTTNLETTVNNIEPIIDIHVAKAKDQEKAITAIKCQALRKNLIFHGIPTNEKENEKETARNFMSTNLKISKDDVEDIMIEEAVRIGLRKGTSRALLVKFLLKPDRDFVKKSAFNLAGTQFGVSEHFPLEVEQRRRLLYPLKKPLKALKKKVRIDIDQLIVDDEPWTREYAKSVIEGKTTNNSASLMDCGILNDTTNVIASKSATQRHEPLKVDENFNNVNEASAQVSFDPYAPDTPLIDSLHIDNKLVNQKLPSSATFLFSMTTPNNAEAKKSSATASTPHDYVTKKEKDPKSIDGTRQKHPRPTLSAFFRSAKNKSKKKPEKSASKNGCPQIRQTDLSPPSPPVLDLDASINCPNHENDEISASADK